MNPSPIRWLPLLAILAGCAATDPPRTHPPIAPATVACAPRTAPPRPIDGAPAEQAVERVVVAAQPDSASTLVDRGWRKSRDDDRDGAVALFDLALAQADADLATDRILWSYGWAMFNVQDYRCALARFEQARSAAPENISWLPQTLAVTYWQLGDARAAINWYDAAAKGSPGCWADAKSAERCTRNWQRAERRALGEVISAWKNWRTGGSG